MENKVLKVAIIGAGGIAKSMHAPAYEKMKNVEIIGVCDIIEERAIETAKKYRSEYERRKEQ